MKHARQDYNRIQDPALTDPSLLSEGSTPIGEDEPVFLLRGQDKLAADIVDAYASRLAEERINEEYNAADLEAEELSPEEAAKSRATASNLWEMEIICREQASKMRMWKGQKTPDIPNEL